MWAVGPSTVCHNGLSFLLHSWVSFAHHLYKKGGQLSWDQRMKPVWGGRGENKNSLTPGQRGPHGVLYARGLHTETR